MAPASESSISPPHDSPASGQWAGVDETVVARVASEAGRTPTTVLPIDGDLLLFCFLCAGLIAGAILGYWWRALFVEGLGQTDGAPSPGGAAPSKASGESHAS